MGTAAYAIPAAGNARNTQNIGILNHDPTGGLPAWLGDYDELEPEEKLAYEFTHIDAVAASGDCFVTLATRIDKIAQGMALDSAEQIELEHVVRTLFYLQDNWRLTRQRRR